MPMFSAAAEEYVPSYAAPMAPPAYILPPPSEYIMPTPIPIAKPEAPKDSVNSRIFQQRLEIADDTEKAAIFDGIYQQAFYLMKD